MDCGARGVWKAFGGVVVRGGVHRADLGREFERAILNSSPKGVIPPVVLRLIELQ